MGQGKVNKVGADLKEGKDSSDGEAESKQKGTHGGNFAEGVAGEFHFGGKGVAN